MNAEAIATIVGVGFTAATWCFALSFLLGRAFERIRGLEARAEEWRDTLRLIWDQLHHLTSMADKMEAIHEEERRAG